MMENNKYVLTNEEKVRAAEFISNTKIKEEDSGFRITNNYNKYHVSMMYKKNRLSRHKIISMTIPYEDVNIYNYSQFINDCEGMLIKRVGGKCLYIDIIAWNKIIKG